MPSIFYVLLMPCRMCLRCVLAGMISSITGACFVTCHERDKSYSFLFFMASELVQKRTSDSNGLGYVLRECKECLRVQDLLGC